MPLGRLNEAAFSKVLEELGDLADNYAVRAIRYEAVLARYSEEDLRRMLTKVARVIPLVANDPAGEINRLVELFEPIKSLLAVKGPS